MNKGDFSNDWHILTAVIADRNCKYWMTDPKNTRHYLDGRYYHKILPWCDKNTKHNYSCHHINSVSLMTVSGCFILPKNGSEAVCHSISFILSSEWLDWLEKNVEHCYKVWISFRHRQKKHLLSLDYFECRIFQKAGSDDWWSLIQQIAKKRPLNKRSHKIGNKKMVCKNG